MPKAFGFALWHRWENKTQRVELHQEVLFFVSKRIRPTSWEMRKRSEWMAKLMVLNGKGDSWNEKMVMAKGRVKEGLRRMRAGFEWTVATAIVSSNLENFVVKWFCYDPLQKYVESWTESLGLEILQICEGCALNFTPPTLGAKIAVSCNVLVSNFMCNYV